MCQTYPGFRCSAGISRAKDYAEAKYLNDPNNENTAAYHLAEHDYYLTPVGLKALYASGDMLAVLKAMDEREERLLTNQRFKMWAKDVSKEDALATQKRLHIYAPWNLIAVDEPWKGEEDIRPRFTSRTVELAYNVAVKAHKDVVRKNGSPYINHPLRVCNRLIKKYRQHISEETISVALLHDAVEDSSLTLNDLRIMGFSERIISGVDSVTKRSGESYPDSVSRAALNRDGRWVKLCDNLDNSSSQELQVFDEIKRLKKQRKYYPAISFLRSVIQATLGQQAA